MFFQYRHFLFIRNAFYKKRRFEFWTLLDAPSSTAHAYITASNCFIALNISYHNQCQTTTRSVIQLIAYLRLLVITILRNMKESSNNSVARWFWALFSKRGCLIWPSPSSCKFWKDFDKCKKSSVSRGGKSNSNLGCCQAVQFMTIFVPLESRLHINWCHI